MKTKSGTLNRYVHPIDNKITKVHFVRTSLNIIDRKDSDSQTIALLEGELKKAMTHIENSMKLKRALRREIQLLPADKSQ